MIVFITHYVFLSADCRQGRIAPVGGAVRKAGGDDMGTKDPVLIGDKKTAGEREVAQAEGMSVFRDAGAAVQLDAQGVVGAWSAAARHATGLADARVIGRKLEAICIDEDLDEKFGAVGDSPVEIELTIDCGVRGNVRVGTVVSPRRDSSGALTGYEVRFPASAGRQPAGFGLADGQAPDYATARRMEMPDAPSFLIDPQSLRIVDANAAAVQAAGRPLGEMKGRPLPQILGIRQSRSKPGDPVTRFGGPCFRLTDCSGAERSFGASLVPVRWQSRNLALCVLYDLSQSFEALADLAASNEELSRLARHDHLTGLFNKAMFHETLRLANARVERSGSLLGVLYIDLDGFKPVNDRFGHDIGDTLLVEVVRRLQSGLRASDVMGRLGGDEFGVILENLKRRGDALKVAGHLLKRLEEPFGADGGERVDISASIGAVVTARTVDNASALVADADRAMYEAKSLGRGRAALAPAGATAKHRRIVRRS